MNQKGISNILIVGTVVLLLVIAGGAGYYFIKDKLEQEGNNQGQGLNTH